MCFCPCVRVQGSKLGLRVQRARVWDFKVCLSWRLSPGEGQQHSAGWASFSWRRVVREAGISGSATPGRSRRQPGVPFVDQIGPGRA